MLKRIEVTAFVDWQAQIFNAGQVGEMRSNRRAENTIRFVTNEIAKILSDRENKALFVVSMRLYHGWHRGLTKTENRNAFDKLLSDMIVPVAVSNVRFDWKQPFGDILVDAFEHRKHSRLGVHLPDTLRDDLEHGGRREKMVDTAIACDVLHSARTDPESWRVVMAEDDDLVPAVFVAEKWAKEKGGLTVILRQRAGHGHLSLNGLLWRMGI